MTYRSTMEAERTPLLGPNSAISSKVLSELKSFLDPSIPPDPPHPSGYPNPYRRVRADVYHRSIKLIWYLDAPLTYEQLIAPDSTYTIIRPLTDKYLELRNQATVFCLLLNKVQFMRDSTQLSINTLSVARATLCEILAIRVLRGWSERSLPLATVLLTPWALFQGASEEVIERAKEDGDEDILTQNGNALEMAIISSSKRFIRSPSCQKVIEGIWSGRIIYSGSNSHALIADNYKKKPLQMYNPHKAPLLDHYRLKVPKIRSSIEYTNFVILFILYVLAVEGLEEDHIVWKEGIFIIYALSYSLDKLAAIREHGLKVFSSSLVNGFDLVFMLIYFVYLVSRTYGFHYRDDDAMALGADWLAIGAVLIFPRLAFVTLANNLMVLSIRSMLTEFFFLMSIGIFCFLGFLYALFTLGQGRFELSQIGWWLLEVYFGLDASGFETSHDVHPFLGPVLMVTYALLSNTLLLTVLVAILGNTFATINADAAAESMFRKAVSTIEGVKADAVFSYQLPFNLVAVVFMWPMSYILNPRWFHKLNVFMIRASNFPVLIAIALYERQKYREASLMETIGDFADKYVGSLPRKLTQAAGFDNFGSKQDISAVFEIEREVGSFYRGWDEENLDEELQLPPAFEDDTPMADREMDFNLEAGKGPDSDPSALTSGGNVYLFPQSAPISASPRRVLSGNDDDGYDDDEGTVRGKSQNVSFATDDDQEAARRKRRDESRSRHNSMPANAPSPQATSFPPRNPLLPYGNRPRRNSSIHEPSPLARLFVRGSGDYSDLITDRLRERRQSMVNPLLAMSQSYNTGLSGMVSPRNRTGAMAGSKSMSRGQSSQQPQSSQSSQPAQTSQPSSSTQPPQLPVVSLLERRKSGRPAPVGTASAIAGVAEQTGLGTGAQGGTTDGSAAAAGYNQPTSSHIAIDKAKSQSVFAAAPEMAAEGTRTPRPLSPIPSRSQTPQPTISRSESRMRSRSPLPTSIPFPRRDDDRGGTVTPNTASKILDTGYQSLRIGKASDVEERESERKPGGGGGAGGGGGLGGAIEAAGGGGYVSRGKDDEWRDKLDEIDKRQKRIENMLSDLLSDRAR